MALIQRVSSSGSFSSTSGDEGERSSKWSIANRFMEWSDSGDETEKIPKWIVKNTFLEWFDGQETHQAVPKRRRSCTAIYIRPAPQVPPPPQAETEGRMTKGPIRNAHGTFDKDGEPGCAPCAWFYKKSGCLNGRNCRYCHLCPAGEMKKRKKQRVAAIYSSIYSPSSSRCENELD
jgi:hypothetical protein